MDFISFLPQKWRKKLGENMFFANLVADSRGLLSFWPKKGSKTAPKMAQKRQLFLNKMSLSK